MTMRQAYLCTSRNHSNGVPKNLPVLNFSVRCGTISSASAVPARKLIVLVFAFKQAAVN